MDKYHGTYQNQLLITDQSGTNIAIPLDYQVITDLTVQPGYLNFGFEYNYRALQLTNHGSGTINWNCSVNQDWIQVSPLKGTTKQEIDSVEVFVTREWITCRGFNGIISIDDGVYRYYENKR